nr:GNAT family N-acetyltransferase [Streptomonospora sp. PA3]
MVRDLGERPPVPGGGDVAVAPRPDGAWRKLWSAAGQGPERVPALHRILDRIPAAGYALERSGASRGCVVVSGEWAGVFAMATRPAERGRGLAGAVLEALLRWARDKGAARSYLLVEEDNPAARRVYSRAGFTYECSYGYRVGPGTIREEALEAEYAAIAAERNEEDQAMRAWARRRFSPRAAE